MASDNQEQALYKLSHILHRDSEIRCSFEYVICMGTFGFWDTGPNLAIWRRNRNQDMICIQLFGQEWLLKNLKVAMLREVIGIGPQRYCIVFNQAPSFYSKLKLILAYLPIEKMFLYPPQESLGGPFLREPWLS